MRRRDFLKALVSIPALEGVGRAMRALNAGPYGPPPAGGRVAPFGINGLIANGQSLSVGYDGSPPLSTTQPYSNVQLWDTSATYDISNANASTLQLMPLVASLRSNAVFGANICAGLDEYPGNIDDSETFDVGMANQLTALALANGYGSFEVSTSCTGISAASLSEIDHGGTCNSFAAGIYEATALHRLAAARGKTWGAIAIPFVHGETDSALIYNTSYQTQLNQLIADYNSALFAAIGQTRPAVMIASQQNTCGVLYSQCPQSNLTAQYNFLNIGASNYYCSGSKYQYPYYPDNGPHLTNYGYVACGEKKGQALFSVLSSGNWLPTYPTTLRKNNGGSLGVGTTSVTLTFHVPFGSLVFDTSLGQPHQTGALSIVWASAKGFEAIDVTALNVTSATNASPIVVGTSTNHGLTTGQVVALPAIEGNTAALGTWQITVVDATHFSLNGSTGNGAYTGNTPFAPYQVAICLPITSVAIVGSNQVTIVLGASAATQLSIGYADSGDTPGGGDAGGFAGGNRCGCLHDQDPFRGRSAQSAEFYFNWCLEFFMEAA
jgi:hypothetical protein